ncbi:MAG TPA: hypothetical protein VIJ39_13380 [Solirubrobacteraceae bacterium]
MRMRATIAALTVASLITIGAACEVQAAPTEVNVRIEGSDETLFEGPILTEGHDVEASSDTQERPCDGINPLDPQNKTAGPTPTAASVDAMSLIGETFDGQWYPGYRDYFITRWGPGREEEGMSWGILVNNVFTNVGGCQYELSTGDEVLWAYNAFGHRPSLALFPAGDTFGTRPLIATAELNKPFQVEVLDYSDDAEDVPPAHPERTGSSPFEGAEVSPVATSAQGFERVESESPASVATDAQGKASITFTERGWHRIKATALGSGGRESAIRSNRLDVCVPAEGESGCGAAPAEDQARAVQRTAEEIEKEEEATHAEEARLHEEEVKRDEEEVKRREEAKLREEESEREAEVKRAPEDESEVLPSTSAPALSTMPLGAGTSPGANVVHSAKPAVKKHPLVRCRRVQGRRTGGHRRALRKCKVEGTQPATPKRHTRPKRHTQLRRHSR